LKRLFLLILLFLLMFLISTFYIFPYVKERTAYFAVNVYYPGELEYKGYEIEGDKIIFKFEVKERSNEIIRNRAFQRIIKLFGKSPWDVPGVYVSINGKTFKAYFGVSDFVTISYCASPYDMEELVEIYTPNGYQVKEISLENKSLVISLEKGNQTKPKIVRYESLAWILRHNRIKVVYVSENKMWDGMVGDKGPKCPVVILPKENVENMHQTNYSTLNSLNDNISISYKKAYFTLFLYYPGEAKYVGYEITNNSILFKFEHLSENVSLKLIKVKELIEFQDEPDVRVLVFVNGTPEFINVVKGLGQPTLPPRYFYHASPLDLETIAIILPPENSTVQGISFENGTLFINCLRSEGIHGKIISSEIIKEHRKEIFEDKIVFVIDNNNKMIKVKGCATYSGEKTPPLITLCNKN